jgi:hypothetical protein
MQRLVVGQSVLVQVGHRLAVCTLTGFADGAAVLTPTERQKGGPMPEFSDDAQLTFEHGSRLVMLNGTLQHDEVGPDLIFSVRDGVQLPPRRRDSRAQVALPAVVATAAGEERQAQTTDVSATGMGIEGTGHGRAGDTIGVRVTLPDATVVAVSAEIVRVGSTFTALRILSFEQGGRDALRRFVLDQARPERAAEETPAEGG